MHRPPTSARRRRSESPTPSAPPPASCLRTHSRRGDALLEYVHKQSTASGGQSHQTVATLRPTPSAPPPASCLRTHSRRGDALLEYVHKQSTAAGNQSHQTVAALSGASAWDCMGTRVPCHGHPTAPPTPHSWSEAACRERVEAWLAAEAAHGEAAAAATLSSHLLSDVAADASRPEALASAALSSTPAIYESDDAPSIEELRARRYSINTEPSAASAPQPARATTAACLDLRHAMQVLDDEARDGLERHAAELSPAALWHELVERWRHLVVHARHDAHYDVYVGRPRQSESQHDAPYGNRHVLRNRSCATERACCVERHRRDLCADRDFVARVRRELRGRTLGCWCSPDSCHGHTLAAIANCTAAELARLLPPRLDAEALSLREAELATFAFPLTDLAEVRRLLACRYAAPTILLGGEFSGAVRDELLTVYGELSLSVDFRAPLTPGMAYVGDMVDVMPLRRWARALFWPPCVHQTLSDTLSRDAKMLDGRAFWGIALVVKCRCVDADCVMVEQPDTIIPQFYAPPTQRVRPSFFGDASRKPINLYLRGTDPLRPPLDAIGAADSGRFHSFADADERDRWRSSWLRYPMLAAAVAWGIRPARWATTRLCYRTEIERLAVEWHRRGLPVPSDYANPTGRPLDAEARAYQLVRGDGDGRRPVGEVPVSLLGEPEPDAATRQHGTAWFRPEAPLARFARLSDRSVVLCLVAIATQPLVFAHLDGFSVVGAELNERYLRGSTLQLATSWIAVAATATRAACFLAGEFLDGPRVAVAPVAAAVDEGSVVRTPGRRRSLLAAGRTFAWCTLAALACCPAAEPAARAITAAAAFVAPVAELADAPGIGARPFRFGVLGAAPLTAAAQLRNGPRPLGADALRRAAADGQALRDALLGLADATSDDLQWADIIRPYDASEVEPHLLGQLPTFDDPALDTLSFTPIVAPRRTSWLPPPPPQPSSARCPLSPWDLMPLATQQRCRRWLESALDDLAAVQEEGINAERRRPPPIAVGQSELHPWARNIVWDFTFERSACGVPLDYALPIETHLNLPYIRDRLRTYPDQRLLSFLLEGVRLEADVELQGVFVPYLTSLAKGFGAVRKELRRLHGKGWYRFFGHMPFWPMYFNGQGSTPRKYEPDRDRRTTEGGGPRKDTYDRSGLRALSINEAAKTYHMPMHYARYFGSPDVEVRRWLRAKGLPRTPEQLLSDLRLRSKWPREIKPTLADAMRNIAVLRRAAKLLGEPMYLFSDDAADYFNQLAMHPSEWPLLGIAFIRDEEELLSSVDVHHGDAELFFISERRLGFGTHPASNVAQRFSDAILHLYRIDMDAADAPHLAADQRPAHIEWRAARAKVAANANVPASGEQRLYFCLCFTDDPIIGVVGVQRAIRALRVWRRLTNDLGLIMAIPEKRTLGAWAKWLGALLLAALGLVIIPKDKLMRAAHAIRETLALRCDWGTYRALVSMLEHCRHITRLPANTLSALYEPHRHRGAADSEDGPSEIIAPSPAMRRQLQEQLVCLDQAGGAPITNAVLRRDLPTPGGVICVASADAATDSVPAGMGGFCHGLYWYLPVKPDELRFLHITVLELLATGFNAITLAPHLLAFRRVVLLSDALATPYTLSRHKPHSAALRHALSCLLADSTYQSVAETAEVAQLFGDGNPAADAVSRNEMARFFTLCRQLGVRPRQLDVPPAVLAIWRRVVHHAQRRNVIVRHDLAFRREPPLPRQRSLEAEEEFRAVGNSCTEKGDGPVAAALRRALGYVPPRPRGAAAAPALTRPTASSAPPAARSTAAPRVPRALARALGGDAAAADPSCAASLRHAARPTCRAAPYGRPRKVPARQTANQRPVAPPLRSERQARRAERLRAAGEAAAINDIKQWAHTRLGRSLDLERLGALLSQAQDLSASGVAEGTEKMNELAWEKWEGFAECTGFEPRISAADAAEAPALVARLLAAFLMFIYPQMRGRGGRRWAKPNSALAYPLAIIRIFEGWKVPMPSRKALRGELNGLIKSFVNVHGKDALAPKRRQPMLFTTIVRICNLRRGERVGGRVWDPAATRSRAPRCAFSR